MSEGYKMKHKK